MRGKQAKILSDGNLEDVLLFAETSRHPLRNKVMVLLSAKAGLRAGEIAHLTGRWSPIRQAPSGTVLELPDHAAKKGSGRKDSVARGFAASPDRMAGSDPCGPAR